MTPDKTVGGYMKNFMSGLALVALVSPLTLRAEEKPVAPAAPAVSTTSPQANVEKKETGVMNGKKVAKAGKHKSKKAQ